MLFHAAVVGHEVFDLVDGENCRVDVRTFGPRMLCEMFQNVVGDFENSLLVVIERADIDIMAAAVVGILKMIRIYASVVGLLDGDGTQEFNRKRRTFPSAMASLIM